jgi:multiple sugar transport system permease protein
MPKTASRTISYAVLGIGALAMFFPLFWLILLSLSHNPSAGAGIGELVGKGLSTDNYADILLSDRYDLYFVNSLISSLAVAFGNCIFCTFVAYAFARLAFPMRNALFATVLVVMMVPAYVVMIPLYREIVIFGWINTYFALIVPFLVTPFGIFFLRQYIAELPYELEEAARIDGASTFTMLRNVIFPLARPALIVLFIYQFLMTWNSFLFPFIFTNTESLRTLPVALTFFQGKQSVDLGHLMAGAGLSALPVLLLFVVFQRKIIAGLTAGAVKG